jgi:DNA-binding GntR family transcriptional regulator
VTTIDDRIATYLGRILSKNWAPETAREIAEHFGYEVRAVRTALGRLERSGIARQAGVASSGTTWTLATDRR